MDRQNLNPSIPDTVHGKAPKVDLAREVGRSRRRSLFPGLLALLGLAACGGVDDDTPSGNLNILPIEWELVFEDEFEGDSLDMSKWNIDRGDGCPDLCGWGNNELQRYRPDNITVDEGILTIQGRQEDNGNYTSGRINTKGKFDFRYGKVEVTAKLPSGQGTWPAIWLLHSDESVYGPWPRSGEIDIMEAFNLGVDGNTAISSTTHYGMGTAPFTGTTSEYDTGIGGDMGFRTYTLEWERDKLRFFVDGVHFQTQNSQNWYVYYPEGEDGTYDEFGPLDDGPRDSPFDQAFHLIMNFAIGGDPVGDPDPSIFPQAFEIDSVRVYECANANPDTGRGCGTADASVVPLKDNDGTSIEDRETDQPYLERMDLFTDGPETIEVKVGDQVSSNTLEVDGFTGDGASVINDPDFVDPEDPENIVWHFAVSGGVANAFLKSQDLTDDEILDTGFDYSGNRLGGEGEDPVGEVAFDMLVNGISDDAKIVIKLDSGFPNLGEVELPRSELRIGGWKTYSVKFDMFEENPGAEGDGVDFTNILNPFVIEIRDGSADVFLDNIYATNACKVVGGCGADLRTKGLPDVVVFDDAVNTDVWGRGIVASDSGSGFTDYTDPDDPNNKVNWREIEADEPERGQILEVKFNDSDAFGVWFIGSSATDLTAYGAGAVQFDIKVLDYGENTEGMTFKIDCTFPCGSGDKALGVVGDGEWETIKFPVSQLTSTGLDLELVSTGIVIFPTTQSGDITFLLDDVRWIAESEQPPLQQIDLPVTFDDPAVDYSLTDFGGATSLVLADPDNEANNVAQTTKGEGSETFAGTTIGTSAGFASPIPFTADDTIMSADVRVPVAGIPVRMKVETADCPPDGSDVSCFFEVDAFPTMDDAWETVSWDFVGIDTSLTYVKATIFFDFGTAGDGSVYYWDNVRFGAPPPPQIGLVNGGFETGDLSGWTVNAGDNTVGAPGAGPRSGAFAAQLTTTDGGGVAEIRQTFAANPGDEINFSTWMLTEAALPVGASFGLAKIVFRDAAGNDLLPESASIGVINTEFPGIESQPFLNDASPVDTWVFSEAQGVAPDGTVEVSFLLLNVDFAGGENPIWFDDAQASLAAGESELTNGGFETGDFDGWDGTGDNVVGAPFVGAHSGSFAAQLTTTDGGGVAEISQTIAASAGDEVNLSVWMLTEAALPAGSSFGLAKIVFRDADGNDLVPTSASIGVINTEFPGIESQPFVNDATPVDTWIFSEAQGIAPAGTAEVAFLLLNVDFAGGENPIWFDTSQATVTGGELPLAQIDLPVTFDDPTVDYTVIDFGDPVSASTVLGEDPDDAGNTVAMTTKPTGAPVWAGTTIGNPDFANPIPFTADETLMSVDVRVPMAGIPVRLKVETLDCPADGSDVTCFAELDAFPMMGDAWETLTWDFSLVGIDTAKTFQKATIFFDFGTEGDDAVYQWDNVRFGGEEPPPPDMIELVNGDFESGDFTGWTEAAGDNTVSAPGVGPQSGASAAQLTTAGGGGVAEIRQTFAANPGDEINFSTWMLTEAPLPVGASFGLAKIVFKDAAGNDLVPASASIGVINSEFPGIESEPVLNDASPAETWVFSEAQGVAPAGTAEVWFLLLNIDFAGGENPIWFDDAAASVVGMQPPGELDPIDLPVTFDDPMVDYTVIDFGDPVAVSTVLGEDPDDAGNTVAITTKPAGAPFWAGTTIGNPNFANPIPFTATETMMSVDVWVPAAGIPVRLKVETADCPADGSDVTCFAELDAFPMMDGAWETLTWDFSTVGIDTAMTFERATIFFDFGADGNDAVYLWDNVRFGAPTPPPPEDIELANGDFETGDFTGWLVAAGDNVVGAPGVGPQAGTFAAQLTTAGGGGVAEIRQIFAASPGDEINLAVWMLTEAALPAGASFGLAKIVFKDAAGNDLLPESASIGVINTEFPGIESQPFLNDASPVDTWVFSEAQGVAPAGTVEVWFLLLNVDFAGGENPIWFDDAQASVAGGPPPGELDQIDLPVTFDDPMVDYTLIDFGDPVSASTVLGEDPDDAGNTVAMTTKPSGAPLWAGTTIGNPSFANPIPFTATETLMSVDVWVPAAGIPVRLKVETADCPPDGSDVTCFAELDAFPMMDGAWETLTWDFSTVGIDTAMTFEKATIFFDFGTDGNDAVYLWDNVRFGGDAPPPPEDIALANGGFETGDFAGWTVNGADNAVDAPGVGPQSGTFAAQLTTAGGGGVADISQTFAANPGDEINLSAWMLSEAALPAGASFGLAKIVFKDASGTDLIPESASIGIINTEFPGIESQPFLNDASPVDIWVFSEAQGIAPADTAEVQFLLLNVDFAGGENPIWLDDAQASLVTGEPELTNGGFETGDFTGWGGTGDNVVAAPVVGAHSGDFAAQLTTMGGGSVADVAQALAANPGDEVNLSVWMLTEAALPVGASFGLAKIVFKDSIGNDLVPESASIGIINTEFPGIESQPFLNDAGAVDTWLFSEAQGIAPAGTVEVRFLLLNVDFAGGENPIWFDDAQGTFVGAGP